MKTPALALLGSALFALPSSALVYSMTGFTIVDNEPNDANFDEAGFAGTDVDTHITGGFNNTRRWGNLGLSTVASWHFGTGEAGDPALSAGSYDVFVSWRDASQSNLNNATYSGTDSFGPIIVDQDPGSLSYAGTLGIETFTTTGLYANGDVVFVKLGTVSILDGTFSLTVTDDPVDAGYIFADAAALRPVVVPVPEPASLAALLGLATLGLGWRRRR